MSSAANEVAQEAYNGMVSWYAAATVGKPKGYRLNGSEEAKRKNWVKTARDAAENAIVDAEDGSADEIEASWWRLQVEKFDAVTTGSSQDAVKAAKEVVSLSNQLQAKRADTVAGKKYQLESGEFELNKARAQVIIGAGGIKPAQGWADSLNCGAADFWSPCGAGHSSNWPFWLLGAAVVIWYGRKKKWF